MNILTVLAETIAQLGENVSEGTIIKTFPRECVFDCEECEFALFNKQTKTVSGSFSHVCPGHAKTMVGCCESGNFQSWRDRELTEKNVLNHIFGIKNAHPVAFCAEVVSMYTTHDASEIFIQFRNRSQCTVHLDRLPNDEWKHRLIQRAEHFSKTLNQLRTVAMSTARPKSELGSPRGNNARAHTEVAPDTSKRICGGTEEAIQKQENFSRMMNQLGTAAMSAKRPIGVPWSPRTHREQVHAEVSRDTTEGFVEKAECASKMTTQPGPAPASTARPIAERVSPRSNKLFGEPDAHTSKRGRISDGAGAAMGHAAASSLNTSPPPSDVPDQDETRTRSHEDTVPSDWPFFETWDANRRNLLIAKAKMDQLMEMDEMLSAALVVYKRNRREQ